MGLDMYLSAHRHVSGWEFDAPVERKRYHAVRAAVGANDFPTSSPGLTVSITVAYWRKANAIHKWFVDNVQDGRDECQESYVTREQLRALIARCKDVKESKDAVVATDLLPPCTGFFFGSDAVDVGYWQDIDDTISQLETCLAVVPEGWDFHYQSSW